METGSNFAGWIDTGLFGIYPDIRTDPSHKERENVERGGGGWIFTPILDLFLEMEGGGGQGPHIKMQFVYTLLYIIT